MKRAECPCIGPIRFQPIGVFSFISPEPFLSLATFVEVYGPLKCFSMERESGRSAVVSVVSDNIIGANNEKFSLAMMYVPEFVDKKENCSNYSVERAVNEL
jgi:hypothetical protein